MDKAQAFTMQLFDALEECLHIEWNAAGEPVAFPAEVNTFSVQRLVVALRELYERNNVLEAVAGFEGYDGHQAAAVGYADDYDAFLKVGMLLGDRVVLWEASIVRELAAGMVIPDRLLAAVCNVLRMKGLVEAGGAVYLPHPRNWNPNYVAALRGFDGEQMSNELLGLVNATVLWQDFHVGAFSWHPDFQTVQALAARFDGPTGDPARHETVYALQGLLHHTDALYLSDVDLASFHRRTRNPAFRRDLRSALSAVKDDFEAGENLESRERAVRKLVDTVAAGLASQRKTVWDWWKEIGTSAGGAVGGGLGMARQLVAVAHDGPSALAVVFLLGAGVAAGAASRRFFTSAFNRPKEGLVFQVFGDLEEDARSRRVKEMLEDEP